MGHDARRLAVLKYEDVFILREILSDAAGNYQLSLVELFDLFKNSFPNSLFSFIQAT